MTTTFEFVREQLVAAGRQGVSQADLFVALRQAPIEKRSKGTYSSFNKMFHALVRLGLVERTPRTAPSTTKYGGLTGILADKTFYRLTREGRQAPDIVWRNPYVANYPEYEDKRRYYVPTGRPRGRPRVERRRRARAERVEIPTPAEARPEPVRERRRLLRVTAVQQIEGELPALRERIEALRVSRDPKELEAIAGFRGVMARLFDRALDALSVASGEERVRLQAIITRLETAPEGFDDVRAGIARGNEVTLQRGIETLLLCCPS